MLQDYFWCKMQGPLHNLIYTHNKRQNAMVGFSLKKKKKKTITGPDMQINLLVRYKVHPSCKINVNLFHETYQIHLRC